MAVLTLVKKDANGVPSLLGIAITQPLVLVFIIMAFGNTSGAHINPYITFSMYVTKMVSFPRMIVYQAAQLLGMVLGSLATRAALGQEGAQLRANDIGGFSWGEMSITQACTVEFAASLFLVSIAYGIAIDPLNGKLYGPIVGPVSAGFGVGIGIFYTGALGKGCTGAGMNPWKALAPAIVTGDYGKVWIYILMPFLAALANSLMYVIAPPKFLDFGDEKLPAEDPKAPGASKPSA